MTASQQLHRTSYVIDGLNASNFSQPQVIDHLRAGGLTAVNATIAAWHTPHETLHLIASMLGTLEQHDRHLIQVHSVEDIHFAKRAQRVGLIFGFQGTEPLGNDLSWLARYYKLGVRIIQLTYNFRNRVGGGCYDREDQGLTEYGRQVIAEMNRLGILIDLSHCGPRTSLEAIELSQHPIVLTHANAAALCNHPRNKSDELLKAVAAHGGVVGAVAFPLLLTGTTVATLADYVRMIDYLVNLLGAAHVGLGPDFMEDLAPDVMQQILQGLPGQALFDLNSLPPTRGFESIAACANVTEALLAHGYDEATVRKILGGNWLNVYRQVWR